MSNRRITGRHYATSEPIKISIVEEKIVSVTSTDEDNLPWIAPALFDLQINGCKGIGFHLPDLTEEQIALVISTCREHGIGAFCPTIVTNSYDALHRGFTALARACEDPSIARSIPCFHLEGPYISSEDGPRGAHPLEHVRPPDLDEFSRLQEAANGRIKLVTLAPEQPGAIPFIEELTNQGIVITIGHTNATEECIHDAIKAGAKLSTHPRQWVPCDLASTRELHLATDGGRRSHRQSDL